jgi:7-cyano-7-deazaguanine synthase
LELKKKAVVVHSGGMDSSICLKIAIEKYGAPNVLSIGFSYNQIHKAELECARNICKTWQVERFEIDISFLAQITHSALTDDTKAIEYINQIPSTLVLGRNGLMARIAAIHAQSLGAQEIYLGVMELEEANSGYRDCNRKYFDLIEQALRIDFDDQDFKIQTPLVFLTKKETMKLADDLIVLNFLLENTITCYKGLKDKGCEKCPACILRNDGIESYFEEKKGPKI